MNSIQTNAITEPRSAHTGPPSSRCREAGTIPTSMNPEANCFMAMRLKCFGTTLTSNDLSSTRLAMNTGPTSTGLTVESS